MEEAIRLATADDIDKLIRLRFDFFAEENVNISTGMYAMFESNLRQYYARRLNNGFFAALAEVDQKIAAAAFMAVTEKPPNLCFPTGKTGTILNVLTYPKYRKKGYATRVMDLLIEVAKKNNLSYLELSATEQGKELYKKLGFKERGARRFTDMKLSLL